MKILLLQPYYKDTWAAPPLGIGYIASVLEKEGFEVIFADLTLKPLSKEEFKNFFVKTNPDFVAISMMVRALPYVKELIEYIKSLKNIPIIIGGPQPTIEPIFTLEYTKADFGVIGEGEKTIVALIKSLCLKMDYKDIKGIVFFNKGDYQVNSLGKLIQNLDSIPFPSWHFISPLKYKQKPALTPVKSTIIAPIVTTRGCPYKCSFCGGPLIWGKSFRMRSAKNIVDEISMLIKDYNVRQIFLEDDNFTLVKAHAIEMCKELISRKIEIPWACPNGIRIDKVDDELLYWMKKAGCYLLGFGIESGNQEILNRAHKQLNLKCVREVIIMAKKYDFITYGFFIIGLPGETQSTIRQTIEFAKKLPLDKAWFNVLVPYPGTEVFAMYSKNKSRNNIQWDDIDTNSGMIAEGIEYEDLHASDLIYWQRRALLEFYFSNPKRLFNVLKNMSFGSLKTLMKTSFYKRWSIRRKKYRKIII